MTNQEYMYILKKYALSDEPVQTEIKTDRTGKTTILYRIQTLDYNYSNSTGGKSSPLNVVEIQNGELIMYVPNVMDDFLTLESTYRTYSTIHNANEALFLASERPKNHLDGSHMIVPYYDTEEERFQAELMGEIIIFDEYKQYVDLIVQKAHDNYKKIMQKTWDKRIIL
jgi:hypothetical protein